MDRLCAMGGVGCLPSSSLKVVHLSRSHDSLPCGVGDRILQLLDPGWSESSSVRRGGVMLGAWRCQVVGVYFCGAGWGVVLDGQFFKPGMPIIKTEPIVSIS